MENGIAVHTKNCPVDVIFVLDESESVKEVNFEKTKKFLSDLVDELAADINNSQTRVGFVTFGNKVTSTNNLNAHSSVDKVQSDISSLSYSGGLTYTDIALAHVRTQMLTSAAGDRSDTRNVVVVITDGQSTHQEKTKVCTIQKLMKKLLHFRNLKTCRVAGRAI